MRVSAQHDGVSVKAYGGTTGVLLAFDVTPERREGLLGFAVEREGGNRPHRWLAGMLPFPEQDHRAGELIPSNVAAIQRFRWSDYSVFPDTDYTYTVHPVYGNWRSLRVDDGPTVIARTAGVVNGEHKVLFNRAAAASQAFSRDFPHVAEEIAAARHERRPVRLPADALAWLTRGVLDQITGFCARALDPTWALDVAIYEYELPEIRAALDAARARGANVRIVYHAKPGDEQTTINETNLAHWPAEHKRARITHAICHDKFIVCSRLDDESRRSPHAVLCGSTNFTENGIYRQANVIHIAETADLAEHYLATFEVLFRGDDPTATKRWINDNNPLARDNPVFAGFSPRSSEKDLDLFVEEINAAKRDVLFCTAFALNERVLDALLGAPHDDILRFGLQNSSSRITGTHRDRTADFVTPDMLNTGLEGFLKESTAGQRGNILIHTKLVVIDFTSETPTVISGSHNLSHNASASNDENYLILRGNHDVADCYGVELMRLYEHYRFRYSHDHPDHDPGPAGPADDRAPKTLATDDSWTDPYFDVGTLEDADRRHFAGTDAA
jgi:phosphatidylserine/phosphatidylglycerophosphate/cardiolipin synthase-like enzyme